MPDHVSGVGVDGDDRRQIQVVATAWAADLPIPWRAVSGADIQQIQLGIVGHGIPGRAAAAILPPFTGPGRECPGQFGRFLRLGRVAGDNVKTPGHLPAIRVIGRKITPHAELSAAIADDDLAMDHTRRTRDSVRLHIVGSLGRPYLLAGHRVERNQAAVEGADEDLAFPYRDAAIDHVAAGMPPLRLGHAGIEFPQLLAAGRINREYPAPCERRIHHAVDHDRRGFQPAVVIEIDRPGEPETIDVAVIDFGERTVALLRIGAAVAEPVGAIRL